MRGHTCKYRTSLITTARNASATADHLSQSRIMVWEYHLVKAITKAVTTVVLRVIDLEVLSTKENLTGFSLLLIA